MDRRNVLKRIGAASFAITAIGAGTASAVGGRGRRVEIDGETYVAFGDVDEDDVDAADVCCQDVCDPRYCDLCTTC